jgi:hypothetical protein
MPKDMLDVALMGPSKGPGKGPTPGAPKGLADEGTGEDGADADLGHQIIDAIDRGSAGGLIKLLKQLISDCSGEDDEDEGDDESDDQGSDGSEDEEDDGEE